MVAVKVTGMRELITYLNNLFPKLEAELDQGNEEFMREVQRFAKLFAPVDTGRLKRFIELQKTIKRGATKQLSLAVRAPYAIYQEFGFEPHTFLSDPGRPGFATTKLPLGKFLYVKRWKPFIQPAVDMAVRKYTATLNSRMDRAIK